MSKPEMKHRQDPTFRGHEKHMSEFLTPETHVQQYMVFPRFLLQTDLSETEKLIYVILLDRARLSQSNPKFVDEQGHVFLIYPIHSLAETINKSEMTVKNALASLEKHDLIRRKRSGYSQPNRIYVKIRTDNNLSLMRIKNCPDEGKKAVCVTDRKLSPNKNEKTTSLNQEQGSRGSLIAYGPYRNVFLTDEDVQTLKAEIGSYEHYIDRLSNYMASTGKVYQNHAATIRRWAERDTASTRNYECKEGESL